MWEAAGWSLPSPTLHTQVLLPFGTKNPQAGSLEELNQPPVSHQLWRSTKGFTQEHEGNAGAAKSQAGQERLLVRLE